MGPAPGLVLQHPGATADALAPRPTFVRAHPRDPGLARIEFGIEEAGVVSLVIYDVSGRRVRELVREPLPTGSHHRTWDGLDDHGQAVANGIYLLRLRTADRALSAKFVLMR
jgi:hypothetical protein